MQLLLLHLSDLHIQGKDAILSRASKIAECLYGVLPDIQAVLVAITGDIAYSGVEAEYQKAHSFLEELLNAIRSETSKPIYLVMVPGNHDGQFKVHAVARKAVITHVLENGDAGIDPSTIEICVAPQASYFEFEKTLATTGLTYGDQLWKQWTFKIDKATVVVSGINASWLSQVPEQQGRLVFPTGRYKHLAEGAADIRIALLHHPLNWYTQETYHPLRQLLRDRYQLILTGHEHVGGASRSAELEGSETIFLEAGALGPPSSTVKSTFCAITLDLEHMRFAREAFLWHDGGYVPENGTAIWDSYIPLPEKRNAEFVPTDEWIERLEDIGATLVHTTRGEKLRMSDLFVFPTMRELSDTDRPLEAISADVIAKEIAAPTKTIIRGDEQTGKSTLLHQLFLCFHRAGLVPVFVHARNLTGTDDQNRRRISKAVEQQYGRPALTRFQKLGKSSTVFLVDNLEDAGANPDTLARVLAFIDRHTERAIITAGESFDVQSVLSAKTAEVAVAFKQYRLIGFGYQLRTQLIKRWYQDGISHNSQAEFAEAVHRAEQAIDAIVRRGFVPATAFNTLVLLQTLDLNQPTTLANAGLAQYYEYLIGRSLLNSGVKPDELDEHFNYLSHLAWEISSTESKTFDEGQYQRFNSTFSTGVLQTDAERRRALLVDAKLLVKLAGSVQFKYAYVRYFFKARYVASRFDEEPAFRDTIGGYCAKLYVKENANTILFLAHHLPGKWLVKEIAKVLSALLANVPIFQLDGSDVKVLNDWVHRTVRMVVDTSDTDRNRSEVRQREDEAEDIVEREPSEEVKSIQELDPVAQIGLIFKASEILGQVLKNRYGSIDRSTKTDLMARLFDAPLRATKVFTQMLEADPERSREWLSNLIRQKRSDLTKEQTDRIAQTFLFTALGSVADAFISRQATLVASPRLRDVSDSLAVKDNLSYRLLSLAFQLSYPGQAPLGEVEALAKELATNYFGFRLLQGLVARHVFMFDVAIDVRQRLGAAVSIEIRHQQLMNLSAPGAKKVPGPGHRPRHTRSLLLRLQDSLLESMRREKDKNK